mmetsp:Transcript_145379/g.270694  ORF Transcript_145379/g.270694 Transcript_145379/m.270694 type:complete len:236 (+) Transcript_145379:399-1106(+)
MQVKPGLIEPHSTRPLASVIPPLPLRADCTSNRADSEEAPLILDFATAASSSSSRSGLPENHGAFWAPISPDRPSTGAKLALSPHSLMTGSNVLRMLSKRSCAHLASLIFDTATIKLRTPRPWHKTICSRRKWLHSLGVASASFVETTTTQTSALEIADTASGKYFLPPGASSNVKRIFEVSPSSYRLDSEIPSFSHSFLCLLKSRSSQAPTSRRIDPQSTDFPAPCDPKSATWI